MLHKILAGGENFERLQFRRMPEVSLFLPHSFNFTSKLKRPRKLGNTINSDVVTGQFFAECNFGESMRNGWDEGGRTTRNDRLRRGGKLDRAMNWVNTNFKKFQIDLKFAA